MESFFGSMKTELDNGVVFETRQQASLSYSRFCCFESFQSQERKLPRRLCTSVRLGRDGRWGLRIFCVQGQLPLPFMVQQAGGYLLCHEIEPHLDKL